MRHIHCGKRLKSAECFDAIDVIARTANKAVYPIRVGPICFDRDGSKTSLRNEDFRNLSANPIKLVCAVARFADQNKARISNKIDNGIKILRRTYQSLAFFVDKIEKRFRHMFSLGGVTTAARDYQDWALGITNNMFGHAPDHT